MKLNTSLLLLSLLCLFTTMKAQEKTVTTCNEVAIGGTQTLDTYLSPGHYTGPELRFITERSTGRQGRLWSRLSLNEVSISDTEKEISGGNELSVMYGLQQTWLRQLVSTDFGLNICAGPTAMAHIGACYNTRNSNNPAQMYLDMAAAVSASASYNVRIWKKNVALGYRIDIPVAGLMFSPNYGQSYYEIFSRGNYDHNIVPTTPFNRPSLRQQLCADIRLGKLTWCIGYLGDYRQASVNNLKQHQYTHALLIGLKY